jgi:hypothetical protein
VVHKSAEIFVQVDRLIQRCHSSNIAVRTNNDNGATGRNSIRRVGRCSKGAVGHLRLVDEHPVNEEVELDGYGSLAIRLGCHVLGPMKLQTLG